METPRPDSRLNRIGMHFGFVGRAAALAAAAVIPVATASGDSTNAPPTFSAPAANSESIIGEASNGKSCRYLSADGKIHCIYDDETASEFIALRMVYPDFPAFGQGTMGSFPDQGNIDYLFLNTEFETRIAGSEASTLCRLALRFETQIDQKFWIWSDELHLGENGQTALVDSDGDRVADLAVAGHWDGAINGTRKWLTPNPYDNAYTVDARRYPARPTFNYVDGLFRGCKPVEAKLAVLSDAAANTLQSIEDDMTEILGVDTDD